MIALLLFFWASPSPAPQPAPAVRAWTMLRDGLTSQSKDTRAKAVHSLGLLRDRSSQMLAEKALDDPDKNVRSEAAAALGKMNALSARPRLRTCLQDPEVQVVLSCANTLFLLKDPAAFDIYYELLTGERKSHKGMVASQMDVLHDRRQVEKLAFETGIGFVPYGGAGWQAIKTIAHDDASPVRALAAQRLSADPHATSGKALAEYTTDKKWIVREGVVEAIARRGDSSLLSAVTPLMEDENETVRYDAAAAVVSLSRRSAPRPAAAKTAVPNP